MLFVTNSLWELRTLLRFDATTSMQPRSVDACVPYPNYLRKHVAQVSLAEPHRVEVKTAAGHSKDAGRLSCNSCMLGM